MGTDWDHSAMAALAEQPPAALAELKAQWQAEAAASAIITLEQNKINQIIAAQEAGDER